MDSRGNANPAWLGQGFEPRRTVDPVSKDVAILDDDVALMDANSKLDPLRCGNPGIAAGYRLLRVDRAPQRIDDASELGEEPVAGRLDQPAAMRGDRRVDHLRPDGPQPI